MPKKTGTPLASAEASPALRVTSVDVMRGITMAGMILVNTAGDFDHVYWPLEHVAWDGLHPADLVFPFFVFVMGVSLVLALGRARELGAPARALWPKILRRAAILVALGILAQNFPVFSPGDFRATGVLQRIALAYLGGAAAMLWLRGPAGWLALAAGLVAGHELLLSFVPVPGFPPGLRSAHGNLGEHLDRVVLGAHRLKSEFDPEGLLGTLPTIATTLFGMLAGRWLRDSREAGRALSGLVIAGLLGVITGLALDPLVPVNKSLWSGSFVLVTAGLAAILLAALHWIVDVRGLRRWALPFEMIGSNAILVYVGSTLVNTTMVSLVVGPTGEQTPKEYLVQGLVWAGGSPELGSFLYAVAFLGLWLGIAALLWSRRIFVKI